MMTAMRTKDEIMSPLELELMRTLHDDQRRRLMRRPGPDTRFTKPKRRRRQG
jgi:hypothetical protein